MTMQQEALQRVRRMQQQAMLTVEGAPPPSPNFMPPLSSPYPPLMAPVPTAASGSFFASTSAPQNSGVGNANVASTPQNGVGNANAASAPQNGVGGANASPLGTKPRAGQGGSQGNSILSQLFGGGQRSNGSSGQQRGGAQQSASPHRPGGSTRPESSANSSTGGSGGINGIFDFVRGKISSTEGGAGLGDSLRSSIGSVSQPLSDLLDAFSIDGEKLVILLVMWVIFNERSDNKMLLLALGYLLL